MSQLATPRPSRSRRSRVVRFFAYSGMVVVFALGATLFWGQSQLSGSLAILDGELPLPGLSAPVIVERDTLGVPTLRGSDRLDLSRALGFLHAQERFFQMDLLRRSSAGELAELVGPAALRVDRGVRIHRFRARAAGIVANLPERQRVHFEAYTAGVNAGLAALGATPFEYLVLRSEPVAWRTEDSVLAVFAMYLDLQGRIGRWDSSYGVLRDVQPELYDFLAARGSEWDAPVEGEAFEVPPIPGLETGEEPARLARLEGGARLAAVGDAGEAPSVWPWDPRTTLDEGLRPGSNNWAVAGSHSRHGGAMVSNDMHLGLRVPNIWYRASFVFPEDDGTERRLTGVTLPGGMVLITGSNGKVAWGFTNSYGDWADLVVLEPTGDGAYQTPDGPRDFEIHREVLRAKGGEEEILEVRETIWGPVFDQDHQGRERALRWVAHDRRAVSLGLLDMELANTLEEAVAAAATCGTPAQNLVVATAAGRIGWTLLGPIPRRKGEHDGRLPTSWASGEVGWDGWLEAEEYPKVLDPEVGRLWTANSRVVGGEMYALLGDSGYDLGARTGQIRDGLLALEKASETDMLAIQLDDRALFLERWRQLLIDTLDADPTGDPRRAEMRRLLDDWSGRAEPSSVAYRLVRAFRLEVRDQVLGYLTAPSEAADERFDLRHFRLIEGPLWKLVSERPAHLLDPRFETWNDQFLAAADAVIGNLTEGGRELGSRTWGERNRVVVAHPLSRFLPGFLAGWLDMPARELPGDAHMPRVQGPTFGASERFTVSPGREDEGLFHMPTGQSGNPSTRFYGNGHRAWAEGEATPFLPGETVHRLELVP